MKRICCFTTSKSMMLIISNMEFYTTIKNKLLQYEIRIVFYLYSLSIATFKSFSNAGTVVLGSAGIPFTVSVSTGK